MDKEKTLHHIEELETVMALLRALDRKKVAFLSGASEEDLTNLEYIRYGELRERKRHLNEKLDEDFGIEMP